MKHPKLCEIPASGGMLGYAPCDLPWGHEGDMHANEGDGFYARQHDGEHHRRQRELRDVGPGEHLEAVGKKLDE